MLSLSKNPSALINEHLILASATGLLFACLLFQIVNYFWHPLRHIPGPVFSKISRAPLLYESLRGRRVRWIMKQHERHGPVIRIAPKKVCVAAEQGIKQIYSNKASKSHAYDAFRYHDVKMCIGLLDVKSAHARRKGLLPAFSRQNLKEMEPVIRLHLERFLQWLEKFDQLGQAIDVFKWFRYLTFDVVTDIAFGQQIGMLVSEDTHFIQQVEYRNMRNGLVRGS
jgi:cytochrome P450